MKSSEYWQKRFALLEKESNAYGISAYKKIEPAFEQAAREIQKEIEAWYGRLAKNNSVSMQEARKLLSANELKEFHWDVNEYIKYGRQNAINQQWMKELENASAKFHISRLEALKIRTQQAAEKAFGNELDYVDKMARKVYSETYYHSIFEMQKGFHIGFEIGQIDERKLNKLIAKPWAADGRNFSDRIWQQKTQLVDELHTQLTRNCLLGKAPDDAINAISKKFNVTKSQAGRLVMTEEAYFHALAQKDAYKELDVEEYKILATLDNKTSEICREMDGKRFPMSEYEPGRTAPPFHCWCRSTTVPYDEDFEGIGERAARDADGRGCYVPSDMTYKEWEREYVKDNRLKDIANSGTINNKTDIPLNVVNNIKPFDLPELSNAENKTLQQAMKNVLNRVNGKAANTECAYYYDAHMNFLKWEMGKSGGGSVNVYHPPFNYIAIHNHPSGGTFSIDDIRRFAIDKRMEHLVIIGNNGNQYVISKLQNFDAANIMNDYLSYMKSLLNKNIPTDIALKECSNYLSQNGGKYGFRYKEITK